MSTFCSAQFVPFLLSMIVSICCCCCCCCCRSKEQNEKSVLSSILSRLEFLWQLPFIQMIRHVMLWNQLRKAVLKKQKICKLCQIKGMPLLTIIRTAKIFNLQQTWNVNEIRKELEKTVLSKNCK